MLLMRDARNKPGTQDPHSHRALSNVPPRTAGTQPKSPLPANPRPATLALYGQGTPPQPQPAQDGKQYVKPKVGFIHPPTRTKLLGAKLKYSCLWCVPRIPKFNVEVGWAP